MSITTKPFRRLLPATLLSLVFLLAACAGGGDDGDTSSADKFDEVSAATEGDDGESGESTADGSVAEPAADDADAPAESESAEDGTGGASPTGLTAADLGRDIIFTGYVEVEVDNVTTAGVDAVDAIQSLGGFVFGQETTGGAEPTSTFIFKVDPKDFDRALELLGGVGDLRNQTVSADDVTERVVDLTSRIEVAELGVIRLRTAMEEATTLTDFADLEALLLAREGELELMRGQLRTIETQVDLATITLVLAQDRTVNNIALAVSIYEEHDDGAACPGSDDRNRLVSGVDLTICFELINTGDQTLTEIALTDTGLEIDDNADLIAVYGDLGEPLAPGQSLIVAHELVTDRDIRMRTRVTAQPVAAEGEDPAGPPVSSTFNDVYGVAKSDEAPGFGDGFDAGKEVIVGLWIAARVTVGFLLPLLILLPFLFGAGVLLRRFAKYRTARRNAKVPPPMAPYVPPAPPAAPTTPEPPAPPTASGEDLGSS